MYHLGFFLPFSYPLNSLEHRESGTTFDFNNLKLFKFEAIQSHLWKDNVIIYLELEQLNTMNLRLQFFFAL